MMKKITLLITLFTFSLGYAQSLPFDFSDSNQLMTGEGGTQTSIVQDAGNDVLQMIGATAAWDNAQINFAENLDLSDDANNTITFRIKPVNGTGSGNHLLKFEEGVGGPATTELAFTTTGTDWQNISLDFPSGLGNYSKMVIFTDAGTDNETVSDTYLVDDIAGGTNITGPPPTVALPFDFSDANQLMAGDGGTATSIVQDAGNDVLQMIGAPAAWDNAQINFTQNVDLSDDANNTITFRIKPVNGTGSGDHLLKFEGGVDGPAVAELPFTTSGTVWQDITLDFPSGLGNFNKIVIFTDKGDANASVSDTYLVDDIAGGTNVTPPTVTPPTTAAPTPPARNDWDVFSVYSDAYTDITIDNFDAGWCGGSTVTEVMIASNNTQHYGSGNACQGIDFATNKIDATGFTHLHFDFYTDEADLTGKVFNVKLVDFGGGTAEASAFDGTFNTGTNPAMVSGSWVSVDLEIPNTFSMADIAQIGITSNLANAWYDNLYIYRAATASVDTDNLLNVSLYPNPATNTLNISSENTIENAVIYSVLGKQVKSFTINKNETSLDISNLNTGIYILKYSVNNTIGTQKFVKQ